jgi:microcin C transport system permease protein
MAQDRFIFMPIRPITRRRIENFKKNRRGYWSLWIFMALLLVTLPASVCLVS